MIQNQLFQSNSIEFPDSDGVGYKRTKSLESKIKEIENSLYSINQDS